MPGVITTGNHPKALWPGIRKWWGREYEKHGKEYEAIFERQTSRKNYEEDVALTGFGLAPIKAEGASVEYDSETQGPTKRYTHVVYGLGWIATQEEMEDNLYDEVAKKRTSALAFSMSTTKNIVGANVLNRAFNNAYTGADSKELLATDHPTIDGTQSNELAVAADMSEASLEDICIQIALAKNTRGLQIALMPKALVVPPNLLYEATRILKSEKQSGTANNDVNALKYQGMFPDGIVVNHYLTDTDAWFVKTNAPSGMIMFQRREIDFSNDNDFDTENAKAKATERYSFGWTDWRGMYGSPGS